MHSVFVTGTDTGIGKTFVCCALLRALGRRGQVAVGMKPVASGCEMTADGLRNADALDLIAASAPKADYVTVNPYAFGDAIAPHLAAADANVLVDPARIVRAHARLSELTPCVIVEGVGGWMAPLGARLMQADLVHALRVPVVLVVGLRLGCLNHALLTARAIDTDGCRMIGWIANRIDADMLRSEDNIDTLRRRIQAPLLGIVQHGCDPASAAASLDDAAQFLATHRESPTWPAPSGS
jgi:dethiobiotin synthetase